MSERPWKRLDNAAQIFPAATTDRRTHLFRLAVTLADPVDPTRLEAAFHAVLPRFPTFRVRLKAGLFWYSLVDEPQLPPIYPESSSPCVALRRDRNPLLLRVRWFGRRLAVEFSHVLTDGMGGLVFLKALTAEYLHSGTEDGSDLRRARHIPDPAEARDDFHELYDPGFPKVAPASRAFQPFWPLLPRGSYAVTTGRSPVGTALSRAKERGASLTEYVAATLLAAFQDVFFELPEGERRRQAKPLRVVIPVNLRPVFGSKTLRNFFVVIPVEIDLRLGRYDFEEIVRKVHHQLQAEMDAKLLKKQVVRNLRGELNLAARVVPLPLKNLVLARISRSYEKRQTASLSNLGKVEWPAWAGSIQSIDFTPPPSPTCRLNAAMVTSGEVLSITLGNLSSHSAVERAFFRRLRRDGLPVAVESNRSVWED